MMAIVHINPLINAGKDALSAQGAAGSGPATSREDARGMPDNSEVFAGLRKGDAVADHTAPNLASSAPADNARGVAVAKTIVLTFSERVMAGKGNIVISSDSGDSRVIAVTDADQVTISGRTVKINPSTDLATDSSYTLQMARGVITDLAGNAHAGLRGAGALNFSTPHTGAPVSSIVVADATLRAGETSLVTITFDEAVKGFANDDLSVANGTLTPVTSKDGGLTWTARLTPAANRTDADNAIMLDNSGVRDLAGNPGVGSTTSNHYAVDTRIPTLVSSAPADNAKAVVVDRNIVLTFSERVMAGKGDIVISSDTGDSRVIAVTDASQISIAGNTVTIDPAADLSTDSSYSVQLARGVIKDLAGNAYAGIGDAATLNFNTPHTGAPVSTVAIDATALKAGDTALLTVTFDEAVKNLTHDDLSVVNGELTPLVSNDGGVTWKATFIPAAGVNAAGNVITLDNSGVRDLAGNAGIGVSASTPYAIDTQRPTVTLQLADNTLTVGETTPLTITFSEAIKGFDNADLSVEGGTLTTLAATDNGLTWRAVFSPAPNLSDAGNTIQLINGGVTDLAGNNPAGMHQSNRYTVDTQRPAAGIVMADAAFKAGDTSLLTITFNEAVQGLDNADLTVAGGTLTALQSQDAGVTWNATFTPTANLEDGDNLATLNLTGVTDLAGNAGSGFSLSNRYAIDTQRPAASIQISNVIQPNTSSLVTVTFSEAVRGLDNADLSSDGGSLSLPASSDGGVSWSALFTPAANQSSTGNVIRLVNSGVTDLAGNAGAGVSTSNPYTIDSGAPRLVASLPADNAAGVQTRSDLVLTFNENVVADNGDIVISSNTDVRRIPIGDGRISINGNTLTIDPGAELSPNSHYSVQISAGAISDAAGNAYAGIGDTTTLDFDTEYRDVWPPYLVRSTPADDAGAVVVVSNIVLTFNESVGMISAGNIVVKADGGVSDVRTMPATDPQLAVSGNIITIAPSASLASGTAYHLEIAPGHVRDNAGNAYAGINDAATLNFTTLGPRAVLAAGTLTLTGTTAGPIVADLSADTYTDNGVAGSITLPGGVLPTNVTRLMANTLSANITATAAAAGSTIVAGSGNDLITGGIGNDSMTGGTGNDSIITGNGDNTVNAGAGLDTVTAGSGNEDITLGTAGQNEDDQAIFASANFNGDDTVAGGAGNNQITISDDATVIDADFAHVTSIETLFLAGKGAQDIILDTTAEDAGVVAVDASSGSSLTIDAHGYVDTGLALFMGGGDNTISSGAGNDRLICGGGADTINGDGGADTLEGGGNNDIYVYNGGDVAAGETLVDTAGTADMISVVTSTNFTDLATPTIFTAAGIERILITSGQTATFTGAQLTGQAIAVNATGADAANLAINVAGGGNVSFSPLTFAAFTNDKSTTYDAFNTDAGFDTLTIQGTAGNENITGTSIADTIIGGAGVDILDGGPNGNDTFVYATMADFVTGGAAVVDAITGGNGSADRIQVNAAINLTTADTLATRLASVEQLVAETQNTAARAHSIVLDTDAKLSSITTIDLSGDSMTTSTGKIDLNGGVGVTLDMKLKGVAAGKNTLTGGAGADTVYGGSNNDSITGGAGKDSLVGGGGDDIFVFNTGNVAAGETLLGGHSNDAVGDTIRVDTDTDFSSLGTATLRTAGHIENVLIVSGKTATFTGAQLTGQTISVNATTDSKATLEIKVTAATAMDFSQLTFVGKNGNKAFDSGTDAVIITGNGSNNEITGTTIADSIDGAAGDDKITGGAGADSLNGGAGDDQFIIAALGEISGLAETIDGGSETDTIVLGESGAVDLSTVALTQVEKIAYNDGGNTLTVESADIADVTTITGGTGTDVIAMSTAGTFSLAGKTLTSIDEIRGTSGMDTITGTVGSDTITGGAGVDELHGGTGTDTFIVASATDGAVGETYDGGGDSDTLRVTGTSAIDFSDDTLTSIEVLDLSTDGGAQSVTLTAAQRTAITTINADAADVLNIKTLTGATVAGTAAIDKFVFLGADVNAVVSSFTSGTDKLNVDDFGTASSLTTVTGSQTNTANTVYFLGAQNAGSADSISNSVAALAAAGTWGDEAVTSYIIVADDNSSAIYKYVGDAGNNDFTAAEFTLVGTIGTAAVAGDVIFA